MLIAYDCRGNPELITGTDDFATALEDLKAFLHDADSNYAGKVLAWFIYNRNHQYEITCGCGHPDQWQWTEE